MTWSDLERWAIEQNTGMRLRAGWRPGLGTMLARLLSRVWIVKRPGCGCGARQRWMDRHDTILRTSLYFGMAASLAALWVR